MGREADLEGLIVSDVRAGVRQMAARRRGDLHRSARSLVRADRVVVVTGFPIPDANPPAAETDGPLAAAALAHALVASGVPAVVASDSFCAPVCAAALDAFAAAVPLVVVDDPAARAALLGEEPAHVVFIERPGPGGDGRYRSMRGLDLTALAAPLHLLSTPRDTVIAIGDGGNEVGMGSLPAELIAAVVPDGARIRCLTPCDHLIVATCSTWGGWALVAALAQVGLVSPDVARASLSPVVNLSALRAMVDRGAVDGVTGTPQLSIDGMPWPVHATMLESMCAASAVSMD